MIRRRADISEFNKIAEEHEFFIWHFVRENQSYFRIFSYFDEPNENDIHELRIILDQFDIPYFESKVEDSVDFILNSGISLQNKIYYNGHYSPVMIGFNRKHKVTSTLDGYLCYCTEGIVKLICETESSHLSVLKKNT